MPVDNRLIRTLRVGDILAYVARPEDWPTDPEKEWRGRVMYVCVDEPRMIDHVRVESLEPGEEGLTEFVYPPQMLWKESGRTEEHESALPSSSEPPPAL